MLRFKSENAKGFLEPTVLENLRPRVEAAHQDLLDKSGAGSGFLGWRELLLNPEEELLKDLETTAEEIRSRADVLLCIGIGGSYLGAKAVIQALTPYFPTAPSKLADLGESDGSENSLEVRFAGHHMSGRYLRELLEWMEGKSIYVNVISKSGTTLEPALTFRIVRRWMEEQFEDVDDRIVVTTDATTGALNQLRDERGYKKYVIPDDVGGRFSVLTPVGLLPIAAAGVDIRGLLEGAAATCDRYRKTEDNPSLEYAALRYQLLQEEYAVEVLATFEPRLSGIGAWWQQLFGESEGKKHTGLYPATAEYSTDLHSLGQYMQEGKRILVETFLMVENDGGGLTVPDSIANLDQLNYLTGKTFTDINRKAYEGTASAHTEGGVPNMTLWLDRITPRTLGEALYFFEHAVAVSGYLLGINPFNQPGVEAYKKAMFDRLGRP